MKELLIEIMHQYTPDSALVESLCQELHKLYSAKKRYYHTLVHIENMLRLAAGNREKVTDWDVFVLAICYHDAIYQALKSDNEEKSAALAEKRLWQIGLPSDQITHCKALIMATKHHQWTPDPACNLLIDIDLAILGTPWESYAAYTGQIRKEYAIYPDVLYKPGRIKVLQRFLERDFIFKTINFQERFELQARKNMQWEIGTLQ